MLTHRTKALDFVEKNQEESSEKTCDSKEIFIEPVVWMKDEITKLEGKLSCYDCTKKVGAFSWIGECVQIVIYEYNIQ